MCCLQMQRLLTILEGREDDNWLICRACEILWHILSCKRPKDQIALIASGGFSILCALLNAQEAQDKEVEAPAQPAQASVAETNAASSDESSPAADHYAKSLGHGARLSVLRVIDCLLSTRDVNILALSLPSVVDTIFALIYSPFPAVRCYGIRLTVSLLASVSPNLVLRSAAGALVHSGRNMSREGGGSQKNKSKQGGGSGVRSEYPEEVLVIAGLGSESTEVVHRNKKALFVSFVEVLSKFDVSRGLCVLEGITHLASVHATYHQDAFYRCHAYQHIISFWAACIRHQRAVGGDITTSTSTSHADDSKSLLLKDIGKTATLAVLRTLTVMLVKNSRIRSKFRQTIGYSVVGRFLPPPK
jgi:hypothetical protein